MSAQGSGETRLSDQIAYHRSLCDAARGGPWIQNEFIDDVGWAIRPSTSRRLPYIAAVTTSEDAAFIAAHSPDVVSALLDVAEALELVERRMHMGQGEHPECLGCIAQT